MKKAISSVLVLGMGILPCVNSFGQKRVVRPNDDSKNISRRSLAPESSVGNEFDSLAAYASGTNVLVRWQMRSEKGNMGFYVHRVDPSGESVINDQIVFGSAAKSGRFPLVGEEYAFLDGFGSAQSSYYVESIDLDGNRTISKTVAPTFSKTFKGKADGVPSNLISSDDAISGFQTEQINAPKEILAQRESTPTPPDPTKHKWVISHPGARIDVRGEGIFRVTFAQLAAVGFDTNSDKSRWQLYRNGVEKAISINDANSSIEFYGVGIDTPESDIQGYFLISGDTAGKRIENIVSRPSTSSITLPSYNQTSSYKERTLFLDTILNGPAENYWGTGISAAGANISFSLNGIDFNSPNSTLELKLQGFSSGLHNIQVTLNGQLITPITGAVAQFPITATQTIPTSLLKDASLGQGPNILNLASTGPTGDFNLFDTVNVSFARKHLAAQDTLKAYTASNKKTQLSGFSTANVRVWDITFDNDPRNVTNLDFQNQGGTFGTVLPSGRARIFYAAEESQIKTPMAVSANDGEILASNTFGADLIIIAYKDFMTQAQTWANYRIGQGFSVKVVNVDEIFNEFNFGNQGSQPISSFLEYAYNNWNPKPGYVLLIGDATRDPRNYSGGGYFNLVPTRMVTTIFTETGSDDSLADFDNDGLAEMAVGRIPSRLTTEIDTVFQKTTNWETNLGSDPMSRGALFAVDQFDATNNIDFAAINSRISGELPAEVSKTVVNRTDANAQTNLIAAFNSGKYIVNYTGHGATGTWAAQSFFSTSNVPSLTNHNTESIATMLTCLNGYFIFPAGNGLAERLLFATNGGAVVTWASTGLTSPDVQEVMARRYFKKTGEGTIPRVGNLVKDAKTVILGGNDVKRSWALLGDPMLKVR
jgi:hypothetical protein